MKTTILTTVFYAFTLLNAMAQTNSNKSKLVLIEIDTRDFRSEKEQLGNITSITRLEIEKLNIYEVINQYDIDYMIAKDNLEVKNCFSTYCIAELADKLNCDKFLTGSISNVSGKIIIVFKIYDAETKRFEKQIIKEYLDYPLQVTKMIRYALKEMHGMPISTDDTKSLTNEFEFDEVQNNPYKARLRSDGPRMGLTYFTGETAQILGAKKQTGGYNAMPTMFQFGYQFERQYLNEGNFQALFEFLPMVTGLDQGLLIPSFTLMNGIRNNKSGWEFAFGPTISLVQKAKGFYDTDGLWNLANDSILIRNTQFFETRMDSRGDLFIQPSFIFAAGRTFKSGKLNIPVNAYFIPSNTGFRVGLSFGFNSRPRFETN